MASIYIFDIILCKFGYQKELSLVILFKVNKSLKIGLYYTILALYLLISLRVEYSKKLLLNAKKIAKKNQNFKIKTDL